MKENFHNISIICGYQMAFFINIGVKIIEYLKALFKYEEAKSV